MNQQVEALFRELADLPPDARSQYYREHHVGEETRSEVEALLSFDPGADAFLVGSVSAAAQRALPQLDASGRRCGPYRLLQMVGRGGMGAVYLAERADGEVSQRVAVKLLPPGAGEAQRERFLQERQILASLTHPNIARLLDAGHLEDGQPFLAMEYIDGRPIDVFAAGLGLRQKVILFIKVCAAVAYLHRNLVVHRDLKPSNILVTAEGEPKLLDFGIAKILDVATDTTLTNMRMLTPDYASPEQVMGGSLSTASDIYSLGAVLYHLLTGKPAHEFASHTPEAIMQTVATREVTRPAKRLPELKGDLDAILLKALRKDPQERYATVEQLSEDLQAFLDSRPVRARSGNALYHARKFLRRYWVPVAAAALIVASLAAGLYVANRERALAQQRFQQVRRLANRVLALDQDLSSLPGSTQARKEIVSMSQQYLDGLRPEAGGDEKLSMEVARAYLALAAVQGLPTSSNLGQYDQARISLGRADALAEAVLAKSPHNREALLLSADVAHNRMILANTSGRNEEALTQARKAIARLENLLADGTPASNELESAFEIFSNVALAHKNQHLYQESVRYARRAIDIASPFPGGSAGIANSYSLIADCLRFSGDLDGALSAIREARRRIERAALPRDSINLRLIFNVLWREGNILGQQDSISLERPAEAAICYQQALDAAEEWARLDPAEAQSRILVGMAAREWGKILAHSDAARALAIYDKALFRLREIRDNSDIRRDEAQTLAESSYVLRRLGREVEAGQRIDAALAMLRAIADYPANRLRTESATAATLRARGDHLAETGQTEAAAATYRELLQKLLAYPPDPERDLRDAVALSRTYAGLASVERRAGHIEDATQLDEKRLNLWRLWKAKLPQNPFIGRQLVAAPVR